MISRTTLTGLCAGAALLAMSMTAAAQVDATDHEAHHPEATEQALPDASPDAAPDAAPGDAPGVPGASGMMGMMTPEMMQMMMRMMGEGGMPGMMGGMRGGPMTEGIPGRGMMGPGMMGGDMMGGGMMGMGGMPGCPMMHGAHGRMGGQALGPGALYGMPHGADVEMTPARVETFLAHMLERHGNPRLAIGEITEAEDGSIIAEIVTTDKSLVQRLAFNRHPGLFRQID